MPLFYQHNINGNTKLAIWKIEEEEDFFLERVPISRSVTHPHKRLQHLAGRYLLPFLFSDFPLSEIIIADTRKPFLQNEKYHFSISHCGNYAAAIVSRHQRVGIDIEMMSPKLEKIRHKFLNDFEYLLAEKVLGGNELQKLTALWSAKEACYKWYGNGKVDFKQHMQLDKDITTGKDWALLPFNFKKESPLTLNVHSHSFEELVLSWVMS